MNIQDSFVAVAILAALFSCTSTASAQSTPSDPDASVDIHIGTLGAGAEVGKQFSPALAGRIGFNNFSYDYNASPQNIKYDGHLKLNTVTALLDIYPSKKGTFHFTAGYVNNSNQLTGAANSADNSTIQFSNEPTLYTASFISSLSAKVKFPSSCLYLGAGFGKPSEPGKRLRFIFDVGALFQGTPSIDLNPTYGPNAPAGSLVRATIQNDINAEETKYRGDFGNFKVYPVVQIGLAVHL
jgi:hypothetical protein